MSSQVISFPDACSTELARPDVDEVGEVTVYVPGAPTTVDHHVLPSRDGEGRTPASAREVVSWVLF